MKNRNTPLALAAISVLPISRACFAAAAGSPATGSPIGYPHSAEIDIVDDGGRSAVAINGQPGTINPFITLGDGTPLYYLSASVVPGDIYFVNPSAPAATIAAMIRFYPPYGVDSITSASVFSVTSFSALNGTPDGSPFDATVYPDGVSASGGLPGMPTVDINQSYVAPSDTSDPADTGTFTFTLIKSPEPASAALFGVGAALLLNRRRKS